MAKADLRKPEIADGWRLRLGAAIGRTQALAQLSLKEFAGAIGRDERQVSRWIEGKERPQLDAILAVEALRAVLIIALAELVHEIEVITELRVRRRVAS